MRRMHPRAAETDVAAAVGSHAANAARLRTAVQRARPACTEIEGQRTPLACTDWDLLGS